MSVYQQIRSVSPDLSTPDLLRFLIKEKFAGEVMVTASLKAPSVVVLKMVADIDAATPVVFCQRGFQFPESKAYRERIIRTLGLQHVSETRGGEIDVQPGDLDHVERMWAESQDTLGRSSEIVHLNQMPPRAQRRYIRLRNVQHHIFGMRGTAAEVHRRFGRVVVQQQWMIIEPLQAGKYAQR